MLKESLSRLHNDMTTTKGRQASIVHPSDIAENDAQRETLQMFYSVFFFAEPPLSTSSND